MADCINGATFLGVCPDTRTLFYDPREEAEACGRQTCRDGYTIEVGWRQKWCNIADGLPARLMSEQPVPLYTVRCNRRPQQGMVVENSTAPSLASYFAGFEAFLQGLWGAGAAAGQKD